MLFEFQVADDVGTDWSGGVCERGAAEAGVKLVGDSRTAHLCAAFEHQRFVSCLGQVEGGDETVVPAAYNDDVASAGLCICIHRVSAPNAQRECLARSLAAERG